MDGLSIAMITEEERKLLLKDLSARLPYGVQCSCTWSHEVPNGTTGCVQELSTFLIDEIEIMDNPEYDCQICDVKPYLRPMSSMTEEELKELNDKYGDIAYFFIQDPPYYHGLQAQHSDIGSIEISEFSEIYDWLNAHHFDYRGLIERGLALEAPEGMYEIK